MESDGEPSDASQLMDQRRKHRIKMKFVDTICKHEREPNKSIDDYPPNPDEVKQSNSAQLFSNMIVNLFKHNKIKDELPSFRIHAGLHAAVRWDKKQKYQDNDLYDFRHAAAALGYCDYFFTEKRLCHLVTQDLLKYDKLFKCKTICKLDDAVECLRMLEK